MARDIARFGDSVRAGFEAQVAMFPHMVDPDITAFIQRHSDKPLGWKLSGAGGGGYLLLVSEDAVEDAVRVSVRRGVD